MKISCAHVLFFLALGTAASTTVAWSCAVWVKPFEPNYRLLRQPGAPGPPEKWKDWWASHAPRGFPSEPMMGGVTAAFGISVESMWATRSDGAGDFLIQGVDRQRVGWPMRCMEGSRWYDQATGRVAHKSYMKIPLISTNLPVQLLLWGTVVNSLFWATASLVLFMAFQFMRRGTRLWRGRCPKCAFDLRGCVSGGCPECGWSRIGT